MRKKNQVSPATPSPVEGWQSKEPDGESLQTASNQEIDVSDPTSANHVSPVPPPMKRNSQARVSRRFNRYSARWGRNTAPNGAGALRSTRISESGETEEIDDDKVDDVTEEPDDPALTLLHYFLRLSESTNDIDFTHMESLLADGADVDAVEETSGCSIMHEVAENWDTTVAQFLYERGANIHCSDASGRTPLHIAASTNHRDMVVWLIKNGAELDVTTIIEKQTPVHHAARNDSILALEVLIRLGGKYEMRDYKGRTPLHLAAELDRTVVADFLLSLDEPANCTVYDDEGSHVITTMIRTMPSVAVQSLNQLHKLAPADRKQFYMLSNIEHQPGNDHADKGIKSPFEMAVEEGRYEILTHTVMEKLIQQKWKHCVRWYFYTYLLLYFIFLLSWSVLIAYPSVQLKHLYVFPRDIWRIIVELIAVGSYIHQIIDEILEIIRSKLNHKHYTVSRTKTLQDDIDNTDISLPEEKKYLLSELERTNKSPPNYFKDPWNVLDIVTYVVIFVVIVLHIADIAAHNTEIAIWTARFSCVAALLIWVRLLKLVRALRALGPLVAIIGELIADILRYFALYSVFFIPYLLSVWVLFGGDQSVSLADNEDLSVFYRVAIVMFRMSLIDSFPYNVMRSIDEVMTAILVITFLIITAVVGLNLFIALLSDTFQRVYDNAQANALLQQARLILLLEQKVSRCTYQKYIVHIHNNCNPLSCFYDDDDDSDQRPGQLQKITHQIHDIVSALQSDRKDDDDKRQASLMVLKDKLEEQDMKLTQLTNHLAEVTRLMLKLQQPVRSPATLDTTSDPPPHHEGNISPSHQESSVRHTRPSSSLVRIRQPRRLSPINAQHYQDSFEHTTRQDSYARTGSNPILFSTLEQHIREDVSQTASTVLRSNSSPPWVLENYAQCSGSEASLRSVVTPSHRRTKKKKQ